jgi:hypothetical protein
VSISATTGGGGNACWWSDCEPLGIHRSNAWGH